LLLIAARLWLQRLSTHPLHSALIAAAATFPLTF
jgi:hypothetical protein